MAAHLGRNPFQSKLQNHRKKQKHSQKQEKPQAQGTYSRTISKASELVSEFVIDRFPVERMTTVIKGALKKGRSITESVILGLSTKQAQVPKRKRK